MAPEAFGSVSCHWCLKTKRSRDFLQRRADDIGTENIENARAREGRGLGVFQVALFSLGRDWQEQSNPIVLDALEELWTVWVMNNNINKSGLHAYPMLIPVHTPHLIFTMT